MGLCFHHRRRARALPLLAAVTVLTALFSGTVAGVALAGNGGKPPSGSGGHPPCPSCPDRTPPAGGGNGAGSGSGGTSGGKSGGASAVPAEPLFTLAPITIVDGVASIDGKVNASVAAAVSANVSATADVKVEVNGNAVAVSAKGSFSASTNIAANGGVTVQAGVSTGITYSISIPASAIPSNGVAASALAQLNADGVTLMVPIDGFVSVDGNGLTASVAVAHLNGIVDLSLNGVSLLAQLQASLSGGGSSSSSPGSSKPGGVKPGGGSGGSAPTSNGASAKVSGNAKSVKLKVTARNGATQTTTIRIQKIRSVIRLGRLLSVSAFGARGIRISRITFNRTGIRQSGKLGIAITVRDRRNYLVRDAVVMVQPFAHHTTIHSSFARMSDMLGRATFSVPVGTASLGHRLYVRVTAQTPLAKTHVTASTFLVACGC